MSGPHIRSTKCADDTLKVESVSGTGRQGSGSSGQGFSKYQKSLPPRFQRQQQVSFCSTVLYPICRDINHNMNQCDKCD